MIFGRVYIKILVSFVIVLFVAEILIFGLFILTAGRIFHSRLEHYSVAKAKVAKAFVEEKIKDAPKLPLEKNESLRSLIQFFAETHDAKVWLTAPDGSIAIKSFEGAVPEDIFKENKKYEISDEGIRVKFCRRHRCYLSVDIETGDIQTSKGKVVFHAYLKGGEADEKHKMVFALGLLVIGGVIALLIVPISRRITGPLNHLRISATRLAEGDLSHRADVIGKDEIGELGQSFNRMADQIERMVSGGRELTANISHELRSPLARINILVELIAEDEQYPDKCLLLNRRLFDIREDIEVLDHLIDRILELSRLDIREKPLKLDLLDPTDLIRDVLNKFMPAIEHKKLMLTTDFIRGYSYPCDRESLLAALSNIFDNAVKFTRKKGKIEVTTKFEKGSYIIRVSNTFDKLSEDDMEKIFEPFHRVANFDTAGSGLGLAITRKIIERHDGTIRALNLEKGFAIEIVFRMSG
ncbi:HAMP domain-containing sensor histidine kinase [Desulfobacterales bacterium HSG16]|nr:HAMP domain-containing sensor histidine kinase [Desulfobacterales bacterium HSG16]